MLIVFLLLCFVSSLSSVVSQSPSLFIISSVNATKERLTPGTPIPFTSQRQPSFPLITFNATKTYQRIFGFGGAMTEAATDNLQMIGPQLANTIIQAYYDPTNGNAYTVTRVPMNSCDFTKKSYNFDDITDDFDLLHFDSKVTHDANTIIPFIQSAISVSKGKLNLFLTPWSPPGWMKGNGQMDGSSVPCLKADKRYHLSWANYYVKFLQAYESYNITFWGMTVQNEPENAGGWESCVYSATDMRDFIGDYLGPIVHKTYPNIKIMHFDHNKDHCVDWADVMFADNIVSEHVWGTAIHWYSGPQYDHVQTLHDHWPDKHILPTEACNCMGVHLDDWVRGEWYGEDVIGDLNSWAEGWTDWNLVLDQKGGPNHLNNFCDAPVITRFDLTPPEVHYQPNYYILGHFSRFLTPGAIRIDHTISGTIPLYSDVTTFRIDLDATNPLHAQLRRLVGADTGSYIVSVIMNSGDMDVDIQLGVGKGFATVHLPKHSIHTVSFVASALQEI